MTNIGGKLRAFGIHLGLSAAVAGALTWLLVQRWYPMPFFAADGGWNGLRLVLVVDVVLGPLLSLVVYNRAKAVRTLIKDYAVIGLIQVAALGFGIWTVFQQRTVLVVFADSAFYTVSADVAGGLGPRARDLTSAAKGVPTYASINMSDDPERQQELRRQALGGGQPLYLRSELLEPFVCNDLHGWGQEGLDPWGKDAKEAAPGFVRQAEELSKDLHADPDQLLFLPLTARYLNLTLVFRRNDCELVDWLRAWRDPNPGPVEAAPSGSS